MYSARLHKKFNNFDKFFSLFHSAGTRHRWFNCFHDIHAAALFYKNRRPGYDEKSPLIKKKFH